MKGVISVIVILLLNSSSGSAQLSDLPNVNKKFLVVLHVIQDSLGNPSADATRIAEIKTQIAQASDFFEPIGMSFEASDVVNTIDDFQYFQLSYEGTLDEISAKYDKDKRINLYLIDRYVDELEGGCGIAGDHAMYMAVGCVNPTSFAHETGHIFGLPHTFVDDSQTLELVDGSNCATEGDLSCDTAPDPFNFTATDVVWADGCTFLFEGQDANGDYYDPDFGNIMSYWWFTTQCNCGIYFSDDQFRKMAAKFFAGLDWW